MVRTYSYDNYELVSPWQKAMWIADSEGNQPTATGKRTYQHINTSQTSDERNAQKNLKLPPISNNREQMSMFLAEEVGKVLSRSKDRLKKITKEFILYDPNDTGLMAKNAAYEILKRYNTPTNGNYQRQLVDLFTHHHEKAKIDKRALTEFLENSRRAIRERTEVLREQDQQQPQEAKPFADNCHGRYDSLPTMNPQRLKTTDRVKAVRDAFSERRDAGLLLEIERTMSQQTSNVNPLDLINQLEEHLASTCRDDENMVDNGHMKSLMSKFQFPINTALTMKCIERLDVHDMGRIEWPSFVEFLHKAMVNSSASRSSDNRSNTASTTQSNAEFNYIPEKPAWEKRKPLSNISGYYGDRLTPQSQDLSSSSNGGFTPRQTQTSQDTQYHSNGYQQSSQRGSISNRHRQQQPDYDSQRRTSRDQSGNNQYSQMDDNLEAAFSYNLQKLRSQQNENAHQQSTGNQDFRMMGDRGESFRRAAEALRDKGKFSNGIIAVPEVEKIINYYNMLFDTNISMEQVDNVMKKYASSGHIEAQKIIDAFGTEIQ